MERMEKLKNTDIDYKDDVIEYPEIERAQSIQSLSSSSEKELITNRVIRHRVITTLVLLAVMITLLILLMNH